MKTNTGQALLLAILTVVILFGQRGFAQVQMLANGKHSIQSLGPDFFVSVPMRKISTGKLRFFNHQAAQRLGLQYPADPHKLEKVLVDHFSYFALSDEEKKSVIPDREFIATYYQDSDSKAPGEALGDGRAVWTGELVLKDGSSIDVVMKGSGQTPLAWKNHRDEGHKDGLQGMSEAVHSFVMSEANFKAGIDTSIDLAVIELPFKKKNKYTGLMEPAAITVRIGKQLRLAHLRYHKDNKVNLKRFIKYMVTHDLGKSGTEKKHLEIFVRTLATDAARYMDTFAVHGSPTLGNRTTLGGTIDLGTFRYLDGHHKEYQYLSNRLDLQSQHGTFKEYIEYYLDYLARTKSNDEDFYERKNQEFQWEFQVHYMDEIAKHWLRRMGLTDKQISSVCHDTKYELHRAVMSLYNRVNQQSNRLISDQEIRPAAFDVHLILSKVHLGWESGRWDQVFASDKPWVEKNQTLESSRNAEQINKFIQAVTVLWQELRLKSKDIENIKQNAKNAFIGNRELPGNDFFYSKEENLLKMVESNFDHERLSRAALMSAHEMLGLYDGEDPTVPPLCRNLFQ